MFSHFRSVNFPITAFSVTVLAALSFLSVAGAQAQSSIITQQMSIAEAMSTALRVNRDIEIRRIAERMARRDVEYESGAFIPRLNTSAEWDRDETASSGATISSLTGTSKGAIALEKKNRLGGTATLGVSATSLSSEDAYLSLESTNNYTTSVSAKYEQPLLDGAGVAVAGLAERLAIIEARLQERMLELQESQSLLTVLNKYFSLYQAREILRFKNNIRGHMKQVQDIIRQKVDMLKLPVTDLNKISASLAFQDKELLVLNRDAERRQSDLLLTIHAARPPNPDAVVALTTTPDDLIRSFEPADEKHALSSALETDPDMVKYASALQALERNIRKARNDLLPDLNMTVQAEIAGNGAADLANSLDDLSTDNYSIQVAGVLSLPIVNDADRSRLLKLEDQKRQTLTMSEKRAGELAHEVRQLILDARTVQHELVLAEESVSLARKSLEDETRRLVAEKSTVLDILIYQADLISAEMGLLDAKVKWVSLLGRQKFFTGEIRSLAGEEQSPAADDR